MTARSTVLRSELEEVTRFLRANGLKPSGIEVLPGRVRISVLDEFDLTLPDQAGELEKLKERLGTYNGRKSKAA